MTHEANSPRVPAGALAWVIAGYRELGLDLDGVAHDLGLRGFEPATNPQAIIELTTYVGLLRRALSHRADFAVEAGKRCAFGTFPLLDCTTAACPTLRTAIGSLVRYFGIVTSNGRWRLEDDALILVPQGELPDWFHIATFEFGVHYTAARFDELVQWEAVKALEVSWPEPPHASSYPRPTRFLAERTCLVLEPDALDLPSRRADPLVAQLLARNAAFVLDAMPAVSTVRQQVQETLVALLPSGLPTMSRVAGELGTSTRTLRRRLHAEGQTFERVRDQVLDAIARERLRDPTQSIAEVAFILGFSDVRAFHRAFLRWTGMTPGRFRAQGPT